MVFRKLFNWLRRKPTPPDDYSAEEEEAWYNEKSEFLAQQLGEEHDMVMHAIIPYVVGGGLDLYYFPSGIAGTGIATKELVDAGGSGPSNSVYKCYELVMFTRETLNLDDAKQSETPFGKIHETINTVLNLIARYSDEATLNPNETCEFPAEMETVGGKCLIFDTYTDADKLGPFGLGLLLIIQLHRSEMEFAMKKGGAQLIAKLKEAGYYPYSDLDRPAVV